jgi:hypothetical protein
MHTCTWETDAYTVENVRICEDVGELLEEAVIVDDELRAAILRVVHTCVMRCIHTHMWVIDMCEPIHRHEENLFIGFKKMW